MSLTLGLGLGIGMSARQGSLLNYEPETKAYVSGLATPISTVEKKKIDRLVKDFKTVLGIVNLSDFFDVAYLSAGETAESSLRNLVKNAHHATAVNSPVFTPFEGFTGNGVSSYIDTNYNPNQQKINASLNSTGIGVYIRNNVDLLIPTIGASDASGTISIIQKASDMAYYSINQTTTAGFVTPVGNNAGMLISNRISSSEIDFYINKTRYNRPSTPSAGIPNLNLWICGRNRTAPQFDTRQVSFMFVGKALTQAQAIAVTNAIEFYMDSNGKGVVV